jgi:hypothetical protein
MPQRQRSSQPATHAGGIEKLKAASSQMAAAVQDNRNDHHHLARRLNGQSRIESGKRHFAAPVKLSMNPI